MPTETTFAVNVQHSVVNMMFEGTTQCELAWDFQGSSPVLQTTKPGQTPAQSSHEDRQQVFLLIKALCQGRLNLDVSSVGGISFRQASTTREDKRGLYDWKVSVLSFLPSSSLFCLFFFRSFIFTHGRRRPSRHVVSRSPPAHSFRDRATVLQRNRFS